MPRGYRAASAAIRCCMLLLAGCIFGGQTGDTNARNIDEPTCRPSGGYAELDDVLFGRFTVRELIESVPEEASLPAVLWPADVVAASEQDDAWDDAPAATSAVLRGRVDAIERVRRYTSHCPWDDGLPLPGTLEVTTEDGSLTRELRGHFSGEPGRVFFIEDRTRDGGASRACQASGVVFFPDDGPASGQVCDDEGNVLRFPSTCDGGAPNLGTGAPWELLPASVLLEHANEHGELSVAWSEGSRSELSIAIELEPESACYRGSAWTARARVRATSQRAGIAIDEVVALGADDHPSDEERAHVIGDACQSIAEGEGEALRELAGLSGEPGVVCVSLVLDDYRGFRGEVVWLSAMDGDGGVGDWTLRWQIEEEQP